MACAGVDWHLVFCLPYNNDLAEHSAFIQAELGRLHTDYWDLRIWMNFHVDVLTPDQRVPWRAVLRKGWIRGCDRAPRDRSQSCAEWWWRAGPLPIKTLRWLRVLCYSGAYSHKKSPHKAGFSMRWVPIKGQQFAVVSLW